MLPSIFLIVSLRQAAYLDPGSGSFLLQLLIGGLVGLLFVIKTYWRQLKSFVRKLFSKTPAETPVIEEEPDAS